MTIFEITNLMENNKRKYILKNALLGPIQIQPESRFQVLQSFSLGRLYQVVQFLKIIYLYTLVMGNTYLNRILEQDYLMICKNTQPPLW